MSDGKHEGYLCYEGDLDRSFFECSCGYKSEPRASHEEVDDDWTAHLAEQKAKT
jgi:hypothetical protein